MQDTNWNLQFSSRSLLLPVITKQLKPQFKEVIVKWSVNIYINFLVIIFSFGQVFNQWHNTLCIYVCVYIYKTSIWIHPFTMAHFKIKYSGSEYGLRCFGCWHFMEDFLVSTSENFLNWVSKILSGPSQQSHQTNLLGLRDPSFNFTENSCWYMYINKLKSNHFKLLSTAFSRLLGYC